MTHVGVGTVVKLALAVCASVIVTVQVLWVPLQEPLQPAKVAPDCGVAVRVILVFPV